MTEIAFHVNVPEKLAYSCRLLRKAYSTGARVTVIGEPETLTELDQLLWSFSPTEFLPHCRADAPAGVISASLIVLAGSISSLSQYDVLVNLGQAIPQDFERFERIVEVVASAHEDAAAGRGRWKHYAARGYALTKYDRAGVGEAT